MSMNEDQFLQKLKTTIEPPTSSLVMKFVPLALISSFISLFICPQFGVSPYKIEPDFLSHLLHQNMFICGLYCGAFLYFTLQLSTWLFLNHYERLQFGKKLSYLPFALAGTYWLALWSTSVHTHYSESLLYNIGWLIAAFMGLIWSGRKSQRLST